MPLLPQRHLNEKELGTLYVTNRVPLHFDTVLKRGRMTAEQEAELHRMIGQLPPDEALLALSLCGRQIYTHLAEKTEMGELQGPLLTEFKQVVINIVEWLGRAIIDMDVYGLEYDQKQLEEVLRAVPEELCILSSLYLELKDACGDCSGDVQMAVRLLNMLHYQSETHADTANAMVDGMDEVVYDPRQVNQVKEEIRTAPRDHVPLPLELQAEMAPQQENVVSFSLFHKA